MKFVILSDIHIRNYTNHNIGDPEFRLKQFITLANTIKDYMINHKIENVIIAGDIFDQATPSALEFDYAVQFLKILIKDFGTQIYIIHGNHDYDSKTSNSAKHAFLRPVCDLLPENLRYYHNATVDLAQSSSDETVSFHFRGWVPDFEPVPKCDVFIGHGYVDGAMTKSGNNERKVRGSGVTGFDNCKLAIVGDIHHKQWVGNIFIPGVAIQNNFNDPHTCHFSILDTEKDLTSKDCIFSVELNPQEYLKFEYNDTDELEGNPLIITKPYPKKIDFTKPVDSGDVVDIDPINFLTELLKDSPCKTEILAAIKKQVSNDNSIASEFKFLIRSIAIVNFKSIRTFSKEFTEKDKFLIFKGENGAGKTTLIQSIVWCLKESLISPRGQEHLVIHNDTETAQVTLEIEYAGSLYVIERRRGTKPYLKILVDGNDDIIVGNNVSDTQRALEKAIPMIGRLNLLYFDQTRDGLLSELNDSERVSLISELSGQTMVQTYTKDVEELLEGLKHDLDILTQDFKVKEGIHDALKANLNLIEDPSESLQTVKKGLSSIQQLKGELTIQKNEVKEILFERYEPEYSALEDEISVLLDKKNKVGVKLDVIKTKILKYREILGVKKDEKCKTCGTLITNENYNEELNTETTSKLKLETKNYLSLNKVFKSRVSEYSKLVSEGKQTIDTKFNLEVAAVSKSFDDKIKLLDENQSTLLVKQGQLKQVYIQYLEYLKSEQKYTLAENDLKAVSTCRQNLAAKYGEIKSIRNTVFGQNGLLSAMILEKITGQMNTDENIKILTYKTMKNGTIKPTLNIQMNIDGHWNDYEKLSGGEKLLSDIILISKMIELVGGVGMVIFDESLKYFDPNFTRKALEILSTAQIGNIFLVYHGELPADLDCELVQVHRENSESKYIFNYKSL